MASPLEKPTPGAFRSRRIAGRYDLIGKIGDGATGIVWRARDTVLSRDVAIKTSNIATALGAESSPAVERMQVEAQALARLEHPAIVRVLDFGTFQEGQPYVVMELLAGEDLERLLARQGSLSDVEAVRLLLPVFDGLALAHECGVLHRDVKPANIFLTKTGRGGIQPKLVDFGLAKLADNTSKLTIDGVVCGSPHYLAPERVRAQPATPLSDVWGIAATLFEVVSGLPPFEGTTVGEVMSAVLMSEPRGLPVDVDAHLGMLLERGLAKEPTARWPSVRLFGQQLAQWLLSRGVTEDACGNSLGSTWISTKPALGFDVGHTSLVPAVLVDDEPALSTSAHSTAPQAGRRTRRRLRAGASALAVALVLVGIAAIAFVRGSERPAAIVQAPPAATSALLAPAPAELPPRAEPVSLAAASSSDPVTPHPTVRPAAAPRASASVTAPRVDPRYENLGF